MRLNLSKKSAHVTEQDRPDVLEQRAARFDAQPNFDHAKLVLIDETWASTNMAPIYGLAPEGECLRAGIPHGHWKRTKLITGLRLTVLATPMMLDGSCCNRDQFFQLVGPRLMISILVRAWQTESALIAPSY